MRTVVILVATVVALALGHARPAAAAAPPNDDFASAAAVTGASGSTTGSSVDATDEADEPASADGGLFGVWYRWTAPISGGTAFDTCADASFDTVIDVYRGSSLDSLTLVASDNDGLCSFDRSLVPFHADAGTSYFIRVSGHNGYMGAFKLSWTVYPNDDFAAAQSLTTLSGSLTSSTAGATDEPDEPFAPRNGVWYSWNAPADGTVTFDTCAAAQFDTTLEAFTGSALSSLARVAVSFDECGKQSRIAFPTSSGRYWIRVGAEPGNWGSFTLTWTFKPNDTTPPTISLAALPVANASGWNNSNVTVTATASDDNGVDSITCGATGAQAAAPSTTLGTRRSVVVNAAGVTTIACTASDSSGNTSAEATQVVRLVTPTTLCALTKQLVRSPKPQDRLGLSALVDPIVTASCKALAAIGPTTTPLQKAVLVTAYKAGVTSLALVGGLSPSDRATLVGLANAL